MWLGRLFHMLQTCGPKESVLHLCFLCSGFACTVMDVPTMSAFNNPSDVPKWASDYSLELSGCYYEGFVDYNLLLSIVWNS